VTTSIVDTRWFYGDPPFNPSVWRNHNPIEYLERIQELEKHVERLERVISAYEKIMSVYNKVATHEADDAQA
jgi:hypothetical protein